MFKSFTFDNILVMRIMKTITLYTLLIACLLSTTLPALAQQPLSQLAQPMVEAGSDRVLNELIVQLRTGEKLDDLLPYLNARQSGSILHTETVASSLNIHLIRFNPVQWPEQQLLEWLDRQKAVEAVQYNYQVEFRTTPNDPEYDFQWGAARIGAPQVWNVTQGGYSALGDTIVVAILDSGFDLEHEDLAGNIWTNPAEILGDGIDNDDNGYIDDAHGWDYNSDSPEIAYGSHGLGVTGILGAKGDNGLGVAGVNWNIKLMFFTITYIDDIIASYEYVIQQRELYNQTNGAEGAFVVATNASFGLAMPMFCDQQPIWGSMYDLLGEVGVLTGAGTANRHRNVDEVGDIPTTCESDFLITVLNGTEAEERQTSSAYGEVAIDMAAPGENSHSLAPFNGYGAFSGNSAAAPHITGAIALLYSLPCERLAEEALTNPSETALWMRSVLLNGVDAQPGFAGITATGGRLNVRNAMNSIAESCGKSNGPLEVLNLFPNPADELLTIVYETPDNEPYDFRIYNALGQLVFQTQDIPNSFGVKSLEVDVSNWPDGLYAVSIQRGEEQFSRKLIVARR
jgi:subtilisin family serine protease